MKIRPYEAKDRERVRMICHKTATDAKYIKNPNLVAAIYADYYVDYEPQNAFILANDNDLAVGYILCAENYKRFIKNFNKFQYSKVKAISLREAINHRLGFIVDRLVGKKYPAHLHIDLLPEAQHQGFGSKLVDTLVLHLKTKGVSGVWLGVGGTNFSGINFYKKYGFSLIYDLGKTGKFFGLTI
ncbi:MAG: N-acetyltransferase [Clostridia bacterium]